MPVGIGIAVHATSSVVTGRRQPGQQRRGRPTALGAGVVAARPALVDHVLGDRIERPLERLHQKGCGISGEGLVAKRAHRDLGRKDDPGELVVSKQRLERILDLYGSQPMQHRHVGWAPCAGLARAVDPRGRLGLAAAAAEQPGHACQDKPALRLVTEPRKRHAGLRKKDLLQGPLVAERVPGCPWRAMGVKPSEEGAPVRFSGDTGLQELNGRLEACVRP